ncbi:MAG: O-antigen ligase family protein [Aureliella sp.]
MRIGGYYAAAWAARLILLALVAVTPWIYGGQFWSCQVWLIVIGVALTCLSWLAACLSPRRAGGGTSLTWPMLGFLALVAMQLVPLPEPLASRLSSTQHFVRQMNAEARRDLPPDTSAQTSAKQDTASSTQSLWPDASQSRTLSILPEQTRGSLAVLALAVVAVWSASLFLVERKWAIALAITLAASGLANAFLGLVQAVSWNDWTLLPDMRSISFSTFISRNSAPDFFATAIGAVLALLGVAFRTQKKKRRKEYRVTYPSASWEGRLRNRMEDIFIDLNTPAVSCIAALALLLVATLATLSRGGAIACFGASLVTLCLAIGDRRGVAQTATVSAVLVVAVIGVLSFFGLDSAVMARMQDLNEAAYTGREGRFLVWQYTLASLQWYGLAGSGLGTYHFALLPFHDHGPNAWFYHAENLFLEILSETGFVGIGLALVGLGMVVRKLGRHSADRGENILLIATIFSTTALFLHSLVDFRLILPGIFLPYAVLVGAFLGRCRRVEHEPKHRSSNGERLHRDARREPQVPHPERSRGRIVLHSLVAVACLLCMLGGVDSARGYAIAERLQHHVDKLEDLPFDQALSLDDAQDEQEEQFDANQPQDAKEFDFGDLRRLVASAIEQHGEHSEVALQAGRAQQLLWHRQAAASVDWSGWLERDVSLTSLERWRLATPQQMTQFLRSEDPRVAPLQAAIRHDVAGLRLADGSFEHFDQALEACPLDERAVWGLLISDTGKLTCYQRSVLGRMLAHLAGNNTRMLVKAGITAVQDGDKEDGLRLIRQAVGLYRQEIFVALEPLAQFVTADDLLELIPDDPVFLASICRQLAAGQGTGPLVDQLIEQRLSAAQLQQLKDNATGLGSAGWADLAWVAQRLGEDQLRISLLTKAVATARNRLDLRFELAQAYHAVGSFQKARQELQACIDAAPQDPRYRTEMANWTQSLDQKP